MRMFRFFVLPILLLTGCQRHAPPPATAGAVAPAVATTAPLPAGGHAYACDAGTSVVVIDAKHARVHLPDGRDVALGVVADSVPPAYAGSALTLTIGDGIAHLSQDDGRNELACRPQ